MTIVEDAYEEMVSEFGREFEHYSHQGYEDDFWNDDKGFPDEPTDTFMGQMVMEETDTEMGVAGFVDQGSFVIRTQYTDCEEGDMIKVEGSKFRVDSVGRREIMGRTFANQLEVVSANV